MAEVFMPYDDYSHRGDPSSGSVDLHNTYGTWSTLDLRWTLHVCVRTLEYDCTDSSPRGLALCTLNERNGDTIDTLCWWGGGGLLAATYGTDNEDPMTVDGPPLNTYFAWPEEVNLTFFS